MSNMKSRIFSISEAAVPTEFYYVREVTPPKAGWVPMFTLTALIFMSGLISFGLLYHVESHKTSAETIISTFDYNGANGYTCQMMSKVTATYVLTAKEEPSLAYNLVNVIESASECESSLQTTSPCKNPLNFFPGTTTEWFEPGDKLGAVTMYGDDIALFWPSTGDITRYNYSSGQFNNGYKLQTPDVTTSLAVDRNGFPIYLVVSSQNPTYSWVYRAFLDGVESEFISASYMYYSHKAVLNDNLYNIYLIQDDSFLSLDVYSATLPVYPDKLFGSSAGNIANAAVYHDGVSPLVYYCTNDTSFVFYYNLNNDGMIGKRLLPSNFECAGLVVDGSGALFVLALYIRSGDPGGYYLMDGAFFTHGKISTLAPTGFAINPSGDRIVFSLRNDHNEPELAFLFPNSSNYYGEWLLQPVTDNTQFGAGWFICNDQVLNNSQYNAAVSVQYPQYCNQNGIVGKLVYNNHYYFSASDLSLYATRNTSQCVELYAPIVSTVSSLPPYSCTRTVHQDFFTSVATSFANTSLLIQMLIFLFAMLLPTIATRFPAKENVCLTRADIKVLKKLVKQINLDNSADIEMKSVNNDAGQVVMNQVINGNY